MAVSTGEPQQHGQPSRKRKREWRKNIDVSEIEAGLESAREQVIKGGIISEKPSEALFAFDITGSESIKRSYQRTHKPLKADEILAARSAIPSIDTRKRSQVTNGIIEHSIRKRGLNGVSSKELERLKKIAHGGESAPKDIIEANGTSNYDPWAPKLEQNTTDPKLSFLEKPRHIKAPVTLHKPPVSLVAGTDPHPAVPKPKLGTSYNPAFQEWDHLLTSEGAKEVDAERKRLEAQRAEREKQQLIAAAQSENEAWQTEDESAWEGLESENEAAGKLSKRKLRRKTPAERNKARRRKAAERQAALDARIKKMEEQARQIEDIADQVETEAKATSRASSDLGPTIKDNKETDDQILRKRNLPERDLELVLPDELQDSLRLLKPEGNLLKDRYLNLLVRGKMEARKPITQPKKARRVATEKWTYKDFHILTGA
ncbi:MAG: hypothetical protein LQ342_000829 [Letrouitia transgressa]|nr:MAG: hypothetical protein LQ342_000829 [Letrouitia transgressa]